MKLPCESLYCESADSEGDEALRQRIQHMLSSRLQARLEKTIAAGSTRTDDAHRDAVRFFERLAALGASNPEAAAEVAGHWSTTFLLARREELADRPEGRWVADSLAGLFLGRAIRGGDGPELQIETAGLVLDLIHGWIFRADGADLENTETSLTWTTSENGAAVEVRGRRLWMDPAGGGPIQRHEPAGSGPWKLPIYRHPGRLGHPGVPNSRGISTESASAESSAPMELGRSLAGAHELLSRVWPEVVEQLPKLVPAFVELPGDHGSRVHLSCSYGPATPIFLSRVDDPALHAEDLVHELQHERFYAAFGAADFASLNSFDKHYISPYRSDPRPLRGLLLGLHAFVAVNELRLRLLETGLVGKSERGLRHFAKSHGKNLFAFRTLMEFDVAETRGRLLMAEIGAQLAHQHGRLVDALPEEGGLAEVEEHLRRHVATFGPELGLRNTDPRFWALKEIAALAPTPVFNSANRQSMELVQ